MGELLRRHLGSFLLGGLLGLILWRQSKFDKERGAERDYLREQLGRMGPSRAQMDRMETSLHAVQSQQRKVMLSDARREQAEQNRRVIEQEVAGHDFEPMHTGDYSMQSTCAVDGCIFPRNRHRLRQGAVVLGSVEMDKLGRIVVRDEDGVSLSVVWEPREIEAEVAQA